MNLDNVMVISEVTLIFGCCQLLLTTVDFGACEL